MNNKSNNKQTQNRETEYKKKSRGRNVKSVDKNGKSVGNNQHYLQLMKDASNIFFSNKAGSNISLLPLSEYLTVPGIMRFNTMLNITGADMVNTAATAIYTYVRHVNSGRTNYEQSDLMMYLLAMSEIYVGYQVAVRAYGLANYVSATNLYYGKYLIPALGFEYDSLKNNLANVRYRLNLIGHRIRALAVPKVFSFFEERLSEVSHIYKDADDDKAQFYFFNPSVLYKFDATLPNGGGLTGGLSLTSTPMLMTDYLTILEDFLDLVLRDEDSNIMSGDILKAYGDDLFVVQPIDENYVEVPIYDVLVNEQVRNAHIVGTPSSTPNITQTNNNISQAITFSLAQTSKISKSVRRYLDIPVADITPELVFTLSKFQCVVETDGNVTTLTSGNMSVILSAFVYFLELDQYNVPLLNYSIVSQLYGVSSDEDDNEDILIKISRTTKFFAYPFIYFENVNSGTGTGTFIDSLPIGDMRNVAVISQSDTIRMNEARFILHFSTRQMT